MVTSRQKILSFLEHRGYASVAELASALNLTPANIRHHISLLLAEGVITPLPDRIHSVGRPSLLYSLTRKTTAHNFQRLSHALLSLCLSSVESDRREPLLRSIAAHLTEEPPPSQSHLTHRMLAAVQKLNEMAYQASWEARRDVPYIRFTHCPYLPILSHHPELCLLDQYLLEFLIDSQASPVALLKKEPNSIPYCLFKILPRPSSPSS